MIGRSLFGSVNEFDVILLSDFRFQGGTSQSNAEEIKAQARIGLSTGLAQVASPLLRRPRPINPAIQTCVDERLATFIPPGVRSRCRLLIIRHPTVLLRGRKAMPRVEADRVVVVINHPPRDGKTGRPYYELARLEEVVRRSFGTVGTWFPIGPLVRKAILREGAAALAPEDWCNILDTADWRTARTSYVSDRPVIGRHSRDSTDKWPTRAEEVLLAYPNESEFRTRILGGANCARAVLGYLPANWEVIPFGATSPRDFLATIDFFVYYHHPGWVESFGRIILEALASGAPAILAPHFADLFGDAAIYAEPAEVREIVRELYRDRARYEERSHKGVALVENRFSHATHARRLESAMRGELVAPGPHTAAMRPGGLWGSLSRAGSRALRTARIGRTDRLATGVLAPDSVYRLRIALRGVPPSGRVLVRGTFQDSGEQVFEAAVGPGERAISRYVVTSERPERIEVALSSEANGAGRAALSGLRAERRGERPKQPLFDFGDTSVTAAMATYPARRGVLPDVVDTLIDQVDKLFIYLNNYEEVPGFIRSHRRRERIAFILDPTSQRRAAAKFHWLRWVRGYHLVCDDDILYPPDYAARMVASVESHARRAIVGVHGVVFQSTVTDARTSRRAVFKFWDPLPTLTPVHFLGTGTIAFHSDLLAALDTSPLHVYPIANDEVLAVVAKQGGVPMTCVARPASWLKPHAQVQVGIFQERAIDRDEHEKATRLLADANPWPELPPHL